MGLSSYIGILVALILIVMITLTFKSNEKYSNNKPSLLSLVAFSLIILNWVLYLFDFYAIMPENIGDLIFLPVWIIVSIIGLIAAYKEFRNNRIFSVINGGLAIISIIMALLATAIGNM